MEKFIDKKCTIRTTNIIDVGGEQMKSYVPVYVNIDCEFYWVKYYKSNKQAREATEDKMEVVLSWDKRLVQEWMRIQLSDDVLWVYWDYTIQNVDVFKKLDWTIDNFTLSCIQRNE